jgi:aryl-alcohol dehydrogenase-like predicted oxidoreductase
VFGWTVSEENAYRLLDRALDQGLNFIDTADSYSRWISGNRGGESEDIIGKWLKKNGRRKDVIVATKVGSDLGSGNKGLGRKHILEGVEASLRRLQTDYIDLYFSHIDDRETPLAETLRTYAQLVREGKVRFIGASNYKGVRLREALALSTTNTLPRYDVLQPLYNLLEREEYESDLAPIAKEYDLGVMPYFGLASGFLSGKYRTEGDVQGKARAGAVSKYLNGRGFSVIEALERVARELHATPAAVALAWLNHQPTITSAIASATSEEQLDSLVEAATLKLDSASVETLSRASQEAAPAA